jgi:hypothetical protein
VQVQATIPAPVIVRLMDRGSARRRIIPDRICDAGAAAEHVARIVSETNSATRHQHPNFPPRGPLTGPQPRPTAGPYIQRMLTSSPSMLEGQPEMRSARKPLAARRNR